MTTITTLYSHLVISEITGRHHHDTYHDILSYRKLVVDNSYKAAPGAAVIILQPRHKQTQVTGVAAGV